MDVKFDDIFLHWQNQFDALSDVNIEFPVDYSTIEIFLDNFLEIKEDTVVTCAGSNPVNIVPSLPSQTEDIGLFRPCTNSANSVPSPVWSASDDPTFAATGTPWTSGLIKTQGHPTSDVSSLQTDTSAINFTIDRAGLQVIPSTCDVVLQPTSINSALESVTIAVSDSELWCQRGSCLTEEGSPPSKRKKQSAARVSQKKVKTNNSQKPVKVQLQPKEIRLPTLEEHILRERKRRDDMAAKFLMLEKFLPPEAKREKAVIVEDAIKLVKKLQFRKEELLKRRAELKRRSLSWNKSEASPQYPSSQSKSCLSYEKLAGELQFAASSKLLPMQVTPSSILDRRKPIDTGTPIIMGHSQNYPIAAATIENMTPLKSDTRCSCRELLQIHAQVSAEEILVEMLFHRYSPNLHTRVMQTVESMKLEVIRGSMQRSVPCGFIECIITAKPRVECQSRSLDTQSSTRLLVGALQAAFDRHI